MSTIPYVIDRQAGENEATIFFRDCCLSGLFFWVRR